MSLKLPANNTDVPAAYVGAWRKQTPDTRSLWLQTTRLHAMVDIPASRPDFSARRGFADLSDDELMILAHQGGVAGACIAAGDVLHRRRQVDYSPQRGQPFLRRLRVEEGGLREFCLDGRETARWERLAGAEGGVLALRFHDVQVGVAGGDECRGYLLRVGPYFAYVRDRYGTTQRAESLALLAELKGFTREQLIAVLDFDLSFGRRDEAGRWIIELSTLPWREGRPFLDDAQVARILAFADRGPEKIQRGGRLFLRYWKLDECSNGQDGGKAA
jgi:hypothetical protein